MKETREEVEWLNYWIQDANDRDKKRILLLGDSVARGYRRTLNTMLQTEHCAVDLLAASYSVLDHSLLEELEHFVSTIGYDYQSIVFQMGFHHGYWVKCKENKEDYDAYYRQLEKILNVLQKLNCNMITVSSTPENTNYPDANNEELKVRSSILQNVSEKYGYPFVDLYHTLYDNKEFAMADIVHYEEKGYEYIAHRISNALGFSCEKIESNRIHFMNMFTEILKNTRHIYLYGDGKKGKILYDYLHSLNVLTQEQYIVSEEFYQKDHEKQVLLNKIKENLDANDLIFVTIEEHKLWEKLKHINIRYYTLSDGLYLFMEGYVTGYRNLKSTF